jgi:hypothetical protein
MNKTIRNATAVFNDSTNKLQLVQIKVLAAQGDSFNEFYCDEREAERQGLARLAEECPGEHWDYVGTLLAQTGGLDRGLVNWAKDFERVEVIA